MEGTISISSSSSKRVIRTAQDEEDEDGNDDLLVEILSRVPYKTLIRSKCVSRRWRRVISHPDNRRRLPRYRLHNTIAGIFYYSNHELQFYGLPGEPSPLIDASFPFLPKCERLKLIDSCNGFLLCLCSKFTDPKKFNYAVCNPATKKWAALPDSTGCLRRPHLGFDPAVSSHFYVFELVVNWLENIFCGKSQCSGLRIYSSNTGVWSDKIDSGWGVEVKINGELKSVFFNGMLHVVAMESSVVAVVDVQGKNWRTIPLPHKEGSHPQENFIGLSQGLLCFVTTEKYDGSKLSVWVLDVYFRDQWTLHHIVSCMDLSWTSMMDPDILHDYNLVSIQERKMFFIYHDRYDNDHKIMSYGVDSGKVCFLHSFGYNCVKPYLSYLPLLLQSLADGP
uniref:F-box domain-containing protein n=1 Tax=Leersia perrieri TaxID=77586 RepID=A0A0D9WEH3_9ORYZ